MLQITKNYVKNKMKTKAIIFDMEGVVIDSEPLWSLSQKVLLEKKGRLYNEEDKAKIAGKSFAEGTLFLKERYDLKEEIEDLILLRKKIIQELFKNKLTFIKGFKEFYLTLNKEYKTCIATSCDDELLSIATNRLKLDQFFKKIFKISDVNNKGKPNPDIFLYAAKKLKVSPEECVVIEDSPAGVEAAKRAGMYCIAITTTFPKESLKNADKIIPDFSEIKLQQGRLK